MTTMPLLPFGYVHLCASGRFRVCYCLDMSVLQILHRLILCDGKSKQKDCQTARTTDTAGNEETGDGHDDGDNL